jgi:hypothetical protein
MKQIIKRVFMNHIIAINLWPSFNFHVNLFSPITKTCSTSTVMVLLTILSLHIFCSLVTCGQSAFYILSMLHGVEDSSLRTAMTLGRKFEKKIPEIKLRGLVPNSFIHVSVGDLYIPTIGQLHECGNWERGRAVTFLGIHTSDLVCSVYLECDRSFLLHICGFVAVSVSMTR